MNEGARMISLCGRSRAKHFGKTGLLLLAVSTIGCPQPNYNQDLRLLGSWQAVTSNGQAVLTSTVLTFGTNTYEWVEAGTVRGTYRVDTFPSPHEIDLRMDSFDPSDSSTDALIGKSLECVYAVQNGLLTLSTNGLGYPRPTDINDGGVVTIFVRAKEGDFVAPTNLPDEASSALGNKTDAVASILGALLSGGG